MKKACVFAEAFGLMVVLQASKIALGAGIRPLLPDTDFVRRMTTAAVMLVFSGLILLYARARKTPLTVFPHPFYKRYIVYTVIASLLLITSPSNFTDGLPAVLLTVYGSIVTPVYEELLFRGYLWNRLETVIKKPLFVFLWSVVLFGVWHLGYMTTQIAAGEWVPVLWKLGAGIGYGVVLGLVRLKSKNCYATILVHGVLNLFMI